jgi:hypothetical protein
MSAYEDYNGPTCEADVAAGYNDYGFRDEGPSVEQLAGAVAAGRCCAECHTEFEKGHGVPTVCTYCGRRLLEQECKVKLAIHPEKNKSAHANEARARKRNRKNV